MANFEDLPLLEEPLEEERFPLLPGGVRVAVQRNTRRVQNERQNFYAFVVTLTNLPDLSLSGFAWDTSAFNSHGILVVVPEPSRAFFILLGLLGLMLRRRRRSGI
jgi:hypothetical protein